MCGSDSVELVYMLFETSCSHLADVCVHCYKRQLHSIESTDRGTIREIAIRRIR